MLNVSHHSFQKMMGVKLQWSGCVLNKFLGNCIRHIPSPEKVLYLTFDDGPHEQCTPQVLDILLRQNVQATFFLVAENLGRNLSVGRLIVAHGHRVGNHSLDHNYHHFFGNKTYLMKWIVHARDFIEHSLEVDTVGFRSPLGIRTPHLGMALRSLQYPLVHWKHRFFDTRNGLPRRKVRKVLSTLHSGDILLLHDTHTEHQESFLDGLEYLLCQAKHCGFKFDALPYDL